MSGESGKKQADNFDSSVKKLERVITRLSKATSKQKTALKAHEEDKVKLMAENKVLLDGLNSLKSDYETMNEAFMKMKEAMESSASDGSANTKEIEALKAKLEDKTFENETLKASIDFIKEEHKNLIEKATAAEKKVANVSTDGASDLQEKLAKAETEIEELKLERDDQDKHLESFARQHALGKNIKTILNKRIDATIVQLEDMLKRQGG